MSKGSMGSLFHNAQVVGESYLSLLMTHNKSVQRNDLGEIRMTAKNSTYFGIYQYIKASEALSRGEILTEVPLDTSWDTTVAIDGAVLAADEVVHIDTNTSAFTVNQYKGYWISVAPEFDSVPRGGMMQIKSHPAIDASDEMDIILERPAGETMDDGDPLGIYLPYLMELVNGDTETIQGVCVEDMTINYYGWMQVGGFVPAVLVGTGASLAVVLHEPLVPNASLAGSAQGVAGNTEADILEAFNSPLTALVAVAQNTVCYIPARMKFSG